ncbi:hypothetical protein D3C78_1680740 [compost metagenome]
MILAQPSTPTTGTMPLFLSGKAYSSLVKGFSLYWSATISSATIWASFTWPLKQVCLRVLATSSGVVPIS